MDYFEVCVGLFVRYVCVAGWLVEWGRSFVHIHMHKLVVVV